MEVLTGRVHAEASSLTRCHAQGAQAAVRAGGGGQWGRGVLPRSAPGQQCVVGTGQVMPVACQPPAKHAVSCNTRKEALLVKRNQSLC